VYCKVSYSWFGFESDAKVQTRFIGLVMVKGTELGFLDLG